MIITKKGIKKELVGKCKICNCEFKTNTYEAIYNLNGWFIKCPECKKDYIDLRIIGNEI